MSHGISGGIAPPEERPLGWKEAAEGPRWSRAARVRALGEVRSCRLAGTSPAGSPRRRWVSRVCRQLGELLLLLGEPSGAGAHRASQSCLLVAGLWHWDAGGGLVRGRGAREQEGSGVGGAA